MKKVLVLSVLALMMSCEPEKVEVYVGTCSRISLLNGKVIGRLDYAPDPEHGCTCFETTYYEGEDVYEIKCLD